MVDRAYSLYGHCFHVTSRSVISTDKSSVSVCLPRLTIEPTTLDSSREDIAVITITQSLVRVGVIESANPLALNMCERGLCCGCPPCIA